MKAGRPPNGVWASFPPSKLVDKVMDILTQSAHQDSGSQKQFQQAVMLYGLARSSSIDGPINEDQEKRLDQAMVWLTETFSEIVFPAAEQTAIDPRADGWHPLDLNAAPHPVTVIYEEKDKPAAPFDVSRFTWTVTRAFSGSCSDEAARGYARHVVQWVLWSLAGQPAVRRWDLISVAGQVLRRIDPIPYLRWSIATKDLDPVGVYREAMGLQTTPSPKLVVSQDDAWDPRKMKQILPPKARRSTSST